MSLSTMLQEFRADLAAGVKPRTEIINLWTYSHMETTKGKKVALSNPRGVFSGYYQTNTKNPEPR